MKFCVLQIAAVNRKKYQTHSEIPLLPHMWLHKRSALVNLLRSRKKPNGRCHATVTMVQGHRYSVSRHPFHTLVTRTEAKDMRMLFPLLNLLLYCAIRAQQEHVRQWTQKFLQKSTVLPYWKVRQKRGGNSCKGKIGENDTTCVSVYEVLADTMW